MTVAPDKITVSNWLAELRMECYKKQLEDFETLKQLLELKEMEQKLKKLGVVNSKDRATMMGSLNSFKKDKPVHPSSVASVQQQEKTLPRKGSTKKSKLKSLLSSGSSKKNKKKSDSFSVSVPATSTSISEVSSSPQYSPPPPPKSNPLSSAVDDYEEVIDLSPRSRAMTDGKSFQNWKVVVENEYVPSPDSSPHFNEQRFRSNTVSGIDQSDSFSPFSRPPNHANGDIQYRTRLDIGRKDDSPGALKNRHLSGASMESGLSFGYDVEKDFNPSLPLENQPWFRGRISRGEAEALLNENGDFIVRENTAILNTYTLTLRWRGEYDHTMINTTEVVNSKGDIRRATGVKYHFESGAFDTIPELVFNHLKYQIPIDSAQHTLITNPICRPGASNSSTPSSTHRSYISQQSYAHPPLSHPEHALSSSFSTLPRNFGRKQSLPEEKGSQTMTRGGGPPPRNSSHPALKQSSSSGDLLDEKPSHYDARICRGVISPPPIAEFRSRAMTTDTRMRQTEIVSPENQRLPADLHTRQESFGDYVAMGSVSVCGDTDSLVDTQERSRTHTLPANLGQPTRVSDRVNYAEISIRGQDKAPPTLTLASHHPGERNVQYAEVRFAQKQPPSSRTISPYQSRTDVLAGRLSVEPSANSTSVGYARIKFEDSSPHPFSQYASIQKSSSPSLSSREGSPRPRSRIDTTPSRTDQLRKVKDRASTASNDSTLSTNSSHSSGSVTPQSSLLVHSHAPSAKVHRELPGYETLVKVHTILQSHSNKQLAYHLTRADAVSFLLAPRPGEDEKVWRDRVNKVSSSSGAYRGLQTLADPDGEKLWKKLYYRHLNLTQTVTLCVITAGDALERAKLLHRFIEIASLLQSEKFGNLFSFISILQGINVPQIKDMADVWDLLDRQFPTAVSLHKNLLSVISNLKEGVPVFPTEQVTIPAIQHFKTVFHFIEPSIPGQGLGTEDKSLVGDYWSTACGLDGIRSIVSHTSQFSYNARSKLERRKCDASLMDFFLGDFTRIYLQSIGVHVDDPMERRRRFVVLMDALVMRVEASETV